LGKLSASLDSDELERTVPIRDHVLTPLPAISGQRVRQQGKKGPKRLPAMQPSWGRSLNPYLLLPVASPSTGPPIESLERKMDREIQGRKDIMDWTLSGRMMSVWPSESSDLMVYPETSEEDRARFIQGLSSTLAK